MIKSSKLIDVVAHSEPISPIHQKEAASVSDQASVDPEASDSENASQKTVYAPTVARSRGKPFGDLVLTERFIW